jgi:hypothetical protein
MVAAGCLAVLAAGAAARGQESLVRYVASERLLAYLEFDGLDAHRPAWEQTALRKVLTETSTGAMLQSIVSQLMAAGDEGAAREGPSREQGAAMLEHMFNHGFAVSLHPPREGGDQSRPRCLLVIRDGGKGDLFTAYLRKLAEQQKGETIEREGRTFTLVRREAESWGFWVEGNDLVFAFGDAVASGRTALRVLAGEEPSAADHPVRKALARGQGLETVALGFVDLTDVPLPPNPRQAGLDGVKRIEWQWGFQGPALASVTRIVAPAPHRGLLALIDQPTFSPANMLPLPAGVNEYAVLSIDWKKFLEALETLPDADRDLREAYDQFRQATGMDLKADVLGTLGSQWAFYIQPDEAPAPATPLGGAATWFLRPPRFSAVVQVAKPEAFRENLAKLIPLLNRQLAARAQGDTPAVQIEKLKEGEGYVLNIPPGVAALPAGVRPTLRIGEKIAAISISPTAAAAALDAKLGDRPELDGPGDNLLFVQQTDPRSSAPEIIANIPFFLGLMGQSAARDANAPPPMKALARVQVDPDLLPNPDAIRKLLFPNRTIVTRDEESLSITTRESLPGISASPTTGGVLIALMLPAVQSAREAARRVQCTNNEKQIALAMHNFHDASGKFPAASIAKDGKPLLSWRVAILPYLEGNDLYEQFHLDEPWDSPHNKTLIEKMPAVYACPSGTMEKGLTPYQVIVGERAGFRLTEPRGLAEITDGTSNTLLVVESKEGVPWTKPDDLEFDPEGELPSLGSNHPGGFNAALMDGSVRFIRTTIKPALLKALITPQGGEVIRYEEIP